MPRVGNKRFPYTPSGIRQAKQAYDRKRNPLASAMAGFNRKQKFGSALNQLRNKAATDARLNERAAQLDPPNQRAASPQPNRRQAIASQIGQDKVYRPDRDGPKRPLPGGNQRGPLGVGGMRPSRRPIRPGRGAIAPRPWRPKPPNRRYL